MRPASAERRRHERIAAAGLLAERLRDNPPLRVRDISLGGFSVEATAPLLVGIECTVRFVAADNWSTVIPARVANCRPARSDSGAAAFVAGITFVPRAERPASPGAVYKIRRFLLTVRYMPRLIQQPWQARWIDRIIEEKLASAAPSTAAAPAVQALFDKVASATG